ncbi:hypothetical protein [Leptospira noguchii]|uniref:hypothetical protein n=1 Tax=Leptospira noguchii TaxID=28182 RepID=UPI000773FDE6|nr:hypothetical protein [Leptospira noguchii]UOG62167.1 hypothetical protein MAL07_09170 [Leptospira noguchii]
MNKKTLGRAEKFALTYESKEDQISFLVGFVEGYKHLKATRSDDAYENGRVYGEKEFKRLDSTLMCPVLRIVK